jgi:hypothetical protein
MFGGRRKRNSVVKNDTVLLSFFFLIKRMKRRRFGENAPFHLNVAPERANFQISPQLSFVHFNCIPAKFIPALIVGRVFHSGPWPLVYAIEPSIDQ